jgi:hypothetical protein
MICHRLRFATKLNQKTSHSIQEHIQEKCTFSRHSNKKCTLIAEELKSILSQDEIYITYFSELFIKRRDSENYEFISQEKFDIFLYINISAFPISLKIHSKNSLPNYMRNSLRISSLYLVSIISYSF